MKFFRSVLFSMLFLFLNTFTYAQCTNTYQFPPNPVPAPTFDLDSATIISPFNWAGDFTIIGGLILDESYIFSSSSVGDYLTIRDAYDDTELLAHGPAPLSYTPTDRDIIAIHINLTSPPCGTENVDRTTTMQCTTCPGIPSAVGVATSEPSAALEVGGELKIGNSARPPQPGMIRWNEEAEDFEGFNGFKWVSFTKSNNNNWGTSVNTEANENQRIQNPSAPENIGYGEAVDLEENIMIVGARELDVEGVNDQGGVFIYEKTGSAWELQGLITAVDGSEDDEYGSAVSIDGAFMAVGAPNYDINGNSNQGAVYIYKRNGNSWAEIQKLIAPDGVDHDKFGEALELKGDDLIIGAQSSTSSGSPGSTYVYTRSGNIWSFQQKLTAYDGANNDRFGCAVAIDGNYAIVGSRLSVNGSTVNAGAAYIFVRSGTTWSFQQKLSVDVPGENDQFGYAVDILGQTCVVGAPYEELGAYSNAGKVYVFFRGGSIWSQTASLQSNTLELTGFFGEAVQIINDYIFIGAPAEEKNSVDVVGATYIFKNNLSIWEQETKLIPSNLELAIYFGSSIAFDGSTIVVGCRGLVESVYTFDYNGY